MINTKDKKVKRIIFSEDELNSIEEAVASAEKKTSGEIVPIIVSQSHDYWWVNWLWGFLGVFTVSFISVLAPNTFFEWGSTPEELLKFQSIGFVAGFLLSLIPFFKRLVLPKAWVVDQVHRQCLANFVAFGLTHTKDRTGVLIYISYFEHRVEILADRGISEKVPKDYWQKEVNLIIEGIKSKKAKDALCQAIKDIGEKLAENFPPTPDDTNELPNRQGT